MERAPLVVQGLAAHGPGAALARAERAEVVHRARGHLGEQVQERGVGRCSGAAAAAALLRRGGTARGGGAEVRRSASPPPRLAEEAEGEAPGGLVVDRNVEPRLAGDGRVRLGEVRLEEELLRTVDEEESHAAKVPVNSGGTFRFRGKTGKQRGCWAIKGVRVARRAEGNAPTGSRGSSSRG